MRLIFHMRSEFMLLCLLLMGTPARGRAEVAPGQDCWAMASCRQSVQEAQSQSQSGRLLEALASYAKAHQLSGDPRFLFNIARLHHKLGHAAEARAYYEQFLEAPFNDPQQKEVARRHLATLSVPLAAPPSPPISDQPVPPKPITDQPVVTKQSSDKLPLPKPSSDLPTPLYRKGWFWGVFAGSAAAVGLGIGLGVGLGTRDPSYPNVYQPSF
jgi:tetratricopeptide (TPR) repeat protein